MNIVDLNTNGCYVEHELLIVDEYGEEVTCKWWMPQLTSAGAGPAALFDRLANDPGRSTFPYIDLPYAPVETIAFPKCP